MTKKEWNKKCWLEAQLSNLIRELENSDKDIVKLKECVINELKHILKVWGEIWYGEKQ